MMYVLDTNTLIYFLRVWEKCLKNCCKHRLKILQFLLLFCMSWKLA